MTSKRRKVDDLSAAQLCRFGLALARFIDGKFPSAVSIAEGLAEGLGRSQGQASRQTQLRGIRMAVADLLEMTRDLPASTVDQANVWLLAEGVASLSAMRERIWRQIPRILARGRIRNEVEYYLVADRMGDVGPDGLDEDERQLAAELVAEYERQTRTLQ